MIATSAAAAYWWPEAGDAAAVTGAVVGFGLGVALVRWHAWRDVATLLLVAHPLNCHPLLLLRLPRLLCVPRHWWKRRHCLWMYL